MLIFGAIIYPKINGGAISAPKGDSMKKFKTESKRMLDLMINSIYTNREIFLRELLSNASDAIDKLYYKSLTEGLSGLTRDDFSINIAIDKEARTITVSDNGIGMTAEELENNLGTIAKSGSLAFKSEKEQNSEIDIIGQFGVGFYSSFMVAKKVEVVSKAFGSADAFKWTSSGAEGYDVVAATKEGTGTDVILYLKDDAGEETYGEFLTDYKIKELVKKYSDYIRYPIKMMVLSYEYPEHEHVEGEEHDHEHEHQEPKEVKKLETLNSMVPVWKKTKAELKDGELEQYYKDNFYDAKDPLRTITLSAEGVVDFKALMFVPETVPYNYYTKAYEKGLALYTSGVMITEKCADLLPDYFNFVRGVVDSDLPLNISRETVQQNRQLKAIASSVEKKIKQELADMLANDREKYKVFFKNFGNSLKYGIYSSWGMKNDLADLLLFETAKGGAKTLKEYVADMPEDQKFIYYACGRSADAIKALPKTGAVVDKGYDILCLTEEVDEFAIKMLRKYSEKEFKSIESGDIGIETESANLDATVAAKIVELLGDKVTKVVGSKSLKDHPVCLTSEGEVSIEMEKVLSALPGSDGAKAQKVLEINVDHKFYEKLKEYAASDNEKFATLVYVMFEQAKLIAGLDVEDPSRLTDKIFELI